jgi:hypothetical protein
MSDETPVVERTVVERPVVERPAAEPRVEHVRHDTTIHDRVVEHDNGSPGWAVRLALGVGGIILLLGALAAWQFQSSLHGSLGMALPWLVTGAIILGLAAIMESITTAVWVTLIGGFFLLFAAYIVTGRVTVALDQAQHAVYVVDRFTGEVRVCNVTGCRDLPGFDRPSVSMTVPPNPDVQQP